MSPRDFGSLILLPVRAACYATSVARSADGRKDSATELVVAHREIARLVAENADLKTLLVEMQRALDASRADLARYRDLYEESRPNRPEHVPGEEQAAALAAALQDLDVTLLPSVAENDDAADAAGASHGPDGSDEPTSSGDGRTRKRHKHGRARIDASKLLVHAVFVDPPEVVAAGGAGFALVSTESSDRLSRSPARYILLRIHRRIFRRLDSDTQDAETPRTGDEPSVPPPDAELLTAPIPGAVWPRLLADPSAIAHAIVSKYDDLLPLHRQEGISRRDGYVVPRSTLCGWFEAVDPVLQRIVDAMFKDAKRTAFCLASDATGVKVRTGFAPCDPWSVFVFVAGQDHVVFRYARTHDSVVLGEMLEGYRGYLLGDATSIYSPLTTMGIIVLVCCWAHVRRYFYKALETDRARATAAIAILGQLFEVERVCTGLAAAEKTAKRAELARPVLELFDAWLDRERTRVDERTPLKAAITYADNQREELRRFLLDGRLRIDNNVCEGLLRKLVLGLNNWKYFENETGLRWYSNFRSLIASCQLHGLCPQRYLECVLRLAPHWSQRSVLELAPKYWRATANTLTAEQLAIVRPEWSSAFDELMAMPPKPTASVRPHHRRVKAQRSSATIVPDERDGAEREDAADRSRPRRRHR